MKKLVIFDFDNTLLETRNCMSRRYGEVSIKLGRGPLRRDEIENSRFFTGEDALKFLFKERFDEAVRIYKTIPHFIELMTPEPLLLEMLDRLNGLKITSAIATNRRGNSLYSAMKFHRLDSYFQPALVLPKKGEKAENLPYFPNHFTSAKPDPQCLEKLLEISGNKKQDAVYVGDSEIDFNCSMNAGIDFIGYKNNFPEINFPLIDKLTDLIIYL